MLIEIRPLGKKLQLIILVVAATDHITNMDQLKSQHG